MASKMNIQRPVFDNPFLNITVNPDGTVKRSPEVYNPASSEPSSISTVLSKDVILDPVKKTWMRLYVPNVAPSSTKLPLVFYYHGGGFVFSNANMCLTDDFCKGLVEKVGVMVVSLDYRLAPENRLPAAYEDAVDGMHWIRTTENDWIKNYADLSNCFLKGSSSGANIAYQAGLRYMSDPDAFRPMRISGLILHHPYFSGTKRTMSEEKLKNDPLLPLYAIDQMFDLSLPEGVDHDHEYSNPLVAPEKVEGMRKLGWRVLVTGCYDDPLLDAGLDFAKMLEDNGVETVRLFSDGYHALEIFDPSMSEPLFKSIKEIIFPSAH